MTIDTLRRFLPSCFFPSKKTTSSTSTPRRPLTLSTPTPSPSPTPTKKRLSTSLRYPQTPKNPKTATASPSSSTSSSTTSTIIAPRSSKSMVIGTIFGNRRGHVWFCVQHDRLALKPTLLLELPLSTHHLVREMRNGLVRIALECTAEHASIPLRSVPVWTVFCNGKRTGFAARRRAGERVRSILRTMRCVTIGAGVIPSGFGSGAEAGSGLEELMYMRANFEHVVGNADSESFHLINPDEGPGQELSVFLLRSRLGMDR